MWWGERTAREGNTHVQANMADRGPGREGGGGRELIKVGRSKERDTEKEREA